MSNRLKPNFTPIPNVILENIMRGLNEGEFKLLMAICRFTYGWGKQSDKISLAQLADLTGMDRSNVARARKRLGNLVTVIPGNATTASTYRLNIEISEAELKLAGSDHSATSDRSATSVIGSDPSATFQRKPKKEDIAASKKRSQRTPKDKDSRVKEFIDWFAREYTTRFKEPYHVKGAKDGKLVKDLLTTFDLAELERRAVRLWESDDKFISGTDRGIGILASQINKLNSTSGTRAPARREMSAC